MNKQVNSSIQTEKEMTDHRDGRLLSRLIGFGLPYKKIFLICMFFGAIVVATGIAQPYFIKIAIDDYIGGLNKPMLSVAEQDQVENIFDSYGKVVAYNGSSYVRVDPGEAAEMGAQIPAGTLQRQIVYATNEEGVRGVYMVDGWLTSTQQNLQAIATGQGYLLVSDEVSISATALSDEQRDVFRDQDIRGFFLLAVLFLMTVILGSFMQFFQMNWMQYTGQDIIFNMRQMMFRHLSKMSMGYFDKNSVGKIVVRVTQDTEAVNQLYSQVVVHLVRDILMLIGIVAVMLYMSVELTLLAFTVIPILAVVIFYYKTTVRAAQRKARIILSRLNSFLAENLSGMRIIQLFIRERRQGESFRDMNFDYYKAGMRSSIINSIFQPAIQFLGVLAMALLIWYGGARVIDGALTFGIVFAFTHYVRMFFTPLQSLAEKYNQIQTALVGAERIFEMLDEQPSIIDPENPKALPDKVQGEISFHNVWFAYEAEDWVLKDVSFTIRPGESCAFVGATGAGKSSIIQLLNRSYDIQKGSITIDGINIVDLPLDELRRLVGIIQQDVFLFSGNFKFNIRLNNDQLDDETVIDAAKQVGMDEFIMRQPDGYETEVGERGVSLSLGQRQLLSFARAVAIRPEILVLDEATSNIDTETEMLVQKALHRISQGRTTLIVAHRLSTIQHADQIIVMHKGRVRESGHHHQLLEQRGMYYRLFELQYKERHRRIPS